MKKNPILLALLLIPTSVFGESFSSEIQNTNSYLLKLSTDASITKNISDLEQNIDPLNWYTYTIILLVFLGVYLYFLKLTKKRKNEEHKSNTLKLSEAEAASLILGNNIAPNFILASILKFSEEGLITIKSEEYITTKSKTKRTNYIFEKTNNNLNNLTNSEKYLYNMLFKNSNEFSTKNLNEKRIKSPSEFNNDFATYIDNINKDLIDKSIKNKNLKYPIIGAAILLISILFIVVSIVSLVLGNIKSIIVLIASIGIFIISLKIMGFQTALGYEQTNYYKHIYNTLVQSNDLKNYQKKNQKNLILYAIACAIPFERINFIKDQFNIDTNYFIKEYWIGENISNMQKEINKSLTGNEK